MGTEGSSGGKVGGGCSMNDVAVIGMDTLRSVTSRTIPATFGSFAKVLRVPRTLDTSSGLVLVLVASTMMEPPVIASVIAVSATPSDEARRE